MGKMKGPKRKKAPERKRLQAGNSGLVAKQSHRQRNGGVYHSPGINGGSTLGKRSLSQQLLLPNKQGRRGKRRRKGDGPISKPRSSEVAAIQMEYDALDAREKGRKDAEEARRRRAAGEIKLVPASASLRLPSKGDTSMTSLQATSSACMVEALLQSITDDPAPSLAPPSRPIRSAGRKRSGNPYASLGGDSDSDYSDANEAENTVRSAPAVGDARNKKIAFAQPSGVFGGSISTVSGGGNGSREVGGVVSEVGVSPKDIVQAQVASEDDDEDPDL